VESTPSGARNEANQESRHGERKQHRERGEARLKSTSAEPAPPVVAVKKPGFFHRVAQFFGRR